MKRAASAFASGLLFAVGLGVAGMTSPRKIVGFLDVFGAWDASLLVVMAGGVGVFAVGHRLALRRGAPLAADRFFVSPPGPLTARHVLGAVLFGAGWGIAGYCPGPAVVALAALRRRSSSRRR